MGEQQFWNMRLQCQQSLWLVPNKVRLYLVIEKLRQLPIKLQRFIPHTLDQFMLWREILLLLKSFFQLVIGQREFGPKMSKIRQSSPQNITILTSQTPAGLPIDQLSSIQLEKMAI